MRKVLKTVCFSMAIMFTSHVGAQTILEADAQTNAINKKSVETNGFWSNWFISAGGGIQTYFGDNDNKADFGKRITPAVDFEHLSTVLVITDLKQQVDESQADATEEDALLDETTEAEEDTSADAAEDPATDATSTEPTADGTPADQTTTE